MELLQSELTELRTTQAKTAKESEKYKEERDAVYSEYKLIMSERDQVISELDKLQTEVELAESKLKSSTSEKKAASEEMEALRQVGAWAAGLPDPGKAAGKEGLWCARCPTSSLPLRQSAGLGYWTLPRILLSSLRSVPSSNLGYRDARGVLAMVSGLHSLHRRKKVR